MMFKNLFCFVSFLVVSTCARALKSGICMPQPSSNVPLYSLMIVQIALRMLLPAMYFYVALMAKVFLIFCSCGQYLTIAKVLPFPSPAYHPATFWKVSATEEELDVFTVSPIVQNDKLLSFADGKPGNASLSAFLTPCLQAMVTLAMMLLWLPVILSILRYNGVFPVVMRRDSGRCFLHRHSLKKVTPFHRIENRLFRNCKSKQYH